MSANASFQIVNERGWRMGFANILRHENARWWRTRRWWINLLIWFAVVNGILLLMQAQGGSAGMSPEQAQGEVLTIFAVASGIFGAIGAAVAMQGSLIDEKKSGTAAWIMSKPASRTAFIAAKLVANGIALPLIVVVIQSIGVYLQLTVFEGSAPALGVFLAGVGLLILNMLFYVSLTLMLGTLFQERGPVVGIPIAFVFAPMLLGSFLGGIANLTPWALVPSNGDPGLAAQVMLGMPLATVLPVVATVVWCVVFVAAAIWRFGRDEF